MSIDVRRVLAEQLDFLLSGHAHFPSDQQIGSVRRINPGALHRAEEFTVAVLDLASGGLEVLRVAG
jgi:predicted phosphodiesterase